MLRSPERLANFKSSFDKSGLQYNVSEAIDGFNVFIIDHNNTESFYGSELKHGQRYLQLGHHYTIICNPGALESSKFEFEHRGGKFSPGLLGVYCSNKMILEQVMPNEKIMICEDDISITSNFVRSLNETLPHIPENFDFFYVGVYRMGEIIQINPYVNKFSPDAIWFTRMALIWSFEGARKFLETPIFYSPMDNFILSSTKSDPPLFEVYVANDDLRSTVYVMDPDNSDINKMLGEQS